jgi:hypothetical protein
VHLFNRFRRIADLIADLIFEGSASNSFAIVQWERLCAHSHRMFASKVRTPFVLFTTWPTL